MKKTFNKQYFLQQSCWSPKKVGLIWNHNSNHKNDVSLEMFLNQQSSVGYEERLHFIFQHTQLSEVEKIQLISKLEKALKIPHHEGHKHIQATIRENDVKAKIAFDVISKFYQ